MFPTGVVEEDDRLLIYYGASDKYCAMVEVSRDDSDDVASGIGLMHKPNLMASSAKIQKVAFRGRLSAPQMRHCHVHARLAPRGRRASIRRSIAVVVPVDDIEGGYDYPTEVRFEIQEQELASYRRAADFLNFANVDVVCLQHEFGIYGGAAGGHILALLRDLRVPVVSTLHTVLRDRRTTTSCA